MVLFGCEEKLIINDVEDNLALQELKSGMDVSNPYNAGYFHNECLVAYDSCIGLENNDTLSLDSIINVVLGGNSTPFVYHFNEVFILRDSIDDYAEERLQLGDISSESFDFLMFLHEHICECDSIERALMDIDDYITNIDVDSLGVVDYYNIVATGSIFIESYEFWNLKLGNKYLYGNIGVEFAIVDAIAYGDCLHEIVENDPNFKPSLIGQVNNACIEASVYSSLSWFVSQL